MEDRTIMESILHTTKGVCDLYLHGTIESSTQNISSAFTTALNESLTMQKDIYSQMSSKGWYSADQAQQQQISQVRSKFSSR